MSVLFWRQSCCQNILLLSLAGVQRGFIHPVCVRVCDRDALAEGDGRFTAEIKMESILVPEAL